jgi:hypothetical protein
LDAANPAAAATANPAAAATANPAANPAAAAAALVQSEAADAVRLEGQRNRELLQLLARMLAGGAAEMTNERDIMQAISSFPVATVTEQSCLLGQPCHICFSEYEVQEEVMTLPCLHQYHEECANKWLITKPTCPICLLRVDTAFEDLQRDNPRM